MLHLLDGGKGYLFYYYDQVLRHVLSGRHRHLVERLLLWRWSGLDPSRRGRWVGEKQAQDDETWQRAMSASNPQINT